MEDLAVQIARFLEAQLTGYSTGVNIFVSDLPETPDNCIAIYNTGGPTPDSDLPTARPTIQILVRNTSYDTAQTLSREIVSELHQRMNNTFVEDGNYAYYCRLLGEPSSIGRDKSEREEFSMNFELLIRR